jgi:hypothetical protein
LSRNISVESSFLRVIFSIVFDKKAVSIFYLFLALNSLLIAENQDPQRDSTTSLKNNFFKKLPYQVDDIMLVGGINSSGVYYSNNFRNLKLHSGFHIGVEKYFPMERILFLNAGILFSQRNFTHQGSNAVSFKNTFLDIPFYASFELPEFRDYDFRFIMGYQFSARLGSKMNGKYAENQIIGNGFEYNIANFKNFDNGWIFGISMEHRNVFVRLRSYMGFTKIDAKDQGMLHSLNFDVGYFIFRPLRKK